MRIGHYMTGLWRAGGVGTYVRRLSDAQRDAGHDVTFFDLERHRPADGDWPGIVYARDEAHLFELASDRAVDVLHAHTLVELAPMSPVPIVRTLHGHEPYCPSGGRFLARQGRACDRPYNAVRCALAHVVDRCGSARPMNILADDRTTRAELRATRGIHVIAVSEFLRGQMLRHGYDADRVHTIHPPATPPAAPTLTPRTRARFVFLGRLTAHKGVDWLLRAASTAKADFAVDIAGEGNHENALKNLSASLGVSARVTFHGWCSPARVKSLLDDCRALVFPSLWPEPAGLVAFDAMAQSRAVVASRIGGIPELVNDRTALLIEPGNVRELAAALDRLTGDLELADQLGSFGRERVSRFTVADHLARVDRVYGLAQAAHGAVGVR